MVINKQDINRFKTYLGYHIMMSFLIIFTSCALIDEGIKVEKPEIPRGNGNLSEVNLPGFLAINLNISGVASSTRAEKPQTRDGFNDGNEEEFALAPGNDHHFIVLYSSNTNDKVILPLTIEDEEKNIVGDDKDNITFIVNKIFSTAQITDQTFQSTQDVSNYLAEFNDGNVLLNFDKSIVTSNSNSTESNEDYIKSLTCDVLRNLTVNNFKITIEGKEYHTMSNELCFNGSNLSYSFEFYCGNVYATREAAKEAAKEGNVFVSCAVERIATKYSVEFAEGLLSETETDNILGVISPKSTIKLFSKDKNGAENGLIIGTESYEIAYDDKGWKLDVLGYGMNAQETKSYFFKQISNPNPFSGWYDGNRCYWAEDLNYTIDDTNKSNYPDQFRQSLDETHPVRPLHKGGFTNDGNININNKNDSFLTYYSFNQLKGKASPIYTHENTYDYNNLLGERGYFSASTHLIMTARININDVAENSDLYLDQNNIFYTNETDLLDSKLTILNKIILSGGAHGLRVLDANWLYASGYRPTENKVKILSWVQNSVLWVEYDNKICKEATSEDLRLIPAEIAGGDGSLLMAPQPGITNIFLAPVVVDENGNRSMDKIPENQSSITPNDLISLFHKSIGIIDHYKDGLSYYPAGIPHVNGLKYDKTGAYGGVRNNWYNITINSVDGIGLPIDDPDQPIIPTQYVKRDYLNMTVNILNWHRIWQDIPESSL